MQLTYIVTCEECGGMPTNRRNIGGVMEKRCDACALEAERTDLAEYFGARYRFVQTQDFASLGPHWIDGAPIGYIDALGLLGAAREQESEVAA